MSSRTYRTLRWCVIWLPLFLFLCAVILPFIPGAMGITDGAGPWYQAVTAKLFLAALVYAYPITLVCTRMISDDMFLSPGYDLVLAVYTALLVLLLRSIFGWFEGLKRSRS
jgi:hypothetical protein